ncbi:MAG: hypothetical protein QOI24_2175 [Acidobacteriota bacterium]|jgi:hypothetical protein|nr:hypothetical protein [Acidobacteriota bacterium]
MSSAAIERFISRNDREQFAIQERLARLNDARLRPRLNESPLSLAEEMKLRRTEASFLATEREAIAERAATAPSDPDAFLAWFEELRDSGPGQHDPLFPWLAEQASLEQLAWFLSQEVAGEAGFDDLVALTQLKMPVRAKLELARNYWDEMGRGKADGMHGPMLDRLAADLNLSARQHTIVWEATAVGNLLMGLAANRATAFESIGALGVIELTAPGRAACVSAGLERLGVPLRTRRYYALHATLDIRHSASWNAEIVVPLVRDDPRVARAIATGALMRLNAGARSFVRYRAELGLTDRHR